MPGRENILWDRSRGAISGLGLLWIGLRRPGEVTSEERRTRKTGNEYERRYFREDLAGVRAHHDRSRNERDELDLTKESAKKKEETNEERGEMPLSSRRILWDSTLDIIFPSRSLGERLIFHDSVASYTAPTMAVISIY